MATRRERENVYGAYVDEREAVSSAIRLARELERAVVVVCKWIDGREVYRLMRAPRAGVDWADYDEWTYCGTARPDGRYGA